MPGFPTSHISPCCGLNNSHMVVQRWIRVRLSVRVRFNINVRTYFCSAYHIGPGYRPGCLNFHILSCCCLGKL